MTEPATLTEFLLARIAADEAAAQEEAERLAERWRQIAAVGMPAVVLTDWSLGPGDTFRVRDRCAAVRRIVALHARGHECPRDDDSDLAGWFEVEDEPCPTLRALASVYADHMDYREEWRPPSDHVCDQERLLVVVDENGQSDHEVCPDCGREFW